MDYYDAQREFDTTYSIANPITKEDAKRARVGWLEHGIVDNHYFI